MATTHDPTASDPRALPRSPRLKKSGLFRFTAEQAYKLAEMGFFDDRHVELLDGILFEMTINPPHMVAAHLAFTILTQTFGADRLVGQGMPLDLGRRTLPEPDIAVVAGTIRDYSNAHPKTAFLVVEVSDSTLRKDRVIKAHIYAQAGLADYWIVNIQDRQVEIHRNPGPDPDRKGRFRYHEITVIGPEGHASPLAAPDARIAVADLLP
jgi:Uma2 family endonuclease